MTLEIPEPQPHQDSFWMQQAINLAYKGIYTTRPNPAVGCVIIKDNDIVGAGYHIQAGGPHAEVFALAEAGQHAQGATAYVTLEPCSHYGRTPPCALALVKAGIKRVVIAGLDPNPLVAGNGVSILNNAGIETTVGVLHDEAENINKGFLKFMRTQMPYVRLKVACSIDGKTALANGESKWITSDVSRQDVQRIRARSGAIITGAQTVILDNPSLTVRQLNNFNVNDIPKPLRVVIDRQGLSNPNSTIYTDQLAPTLLATLNSAPYQNLAHLEFTDTIDLTALLLELAEKYQVRDVMVEAGATLSGAFLAQNLVDELIVYQAPCLLGNTARDLANFNCLTLNNKLNFALQSAKPIGSDLKLIFKSID